MTEESLAASLERRFSGRPHVGSVSHIEGMDLDDLAGRIDQLLTELGLARQSGLVMTSGRLEYHATAAVPVGQGGEAWVVAAEQAGVGCKVDVRVFHQLEDSALADEYLAGFAKRLGDVLWQR